MRARGNTHTHTHSPCRHRRSVCENLTSLPTFAFFPLRLKEGITVPRWVWGPASNRRGPYNLPPIPVCMEGEAIFTFEEEDDGAQLYQ